MTVVVEGPAGVAWVGRYHERNDRGVLLHDVAVHDAAVAALPRGEWIERLRKFGIRVEQRAVTIPADQAGRITTLGEWEAAGASTS